MFWIKRHVTFHKTTRRLKQNNTSLFTNQPKGDGDTCDSKKCKIPVLGAYAARTLHAREGDRYTRIRQLSLIGEIGDCIAVKSTSILQYENSILVLQKIFSSLFCVFSLIRAISTHILVEGASKRCSTSSHFYLHGESHSNISRKKILHTFLLSHD